MCFSLFYFHSGEYKFHIKKLSHINIIYKQLYYNQFLISLTLQTSQLQHITRVCLLKVLTMLRLYCILLLFTLFFITFDSP